MCIREWADSGRSGPTHGRTKSVVRHSWPTASLAGADLWLRPVQQVWWFAVGEENQLDTTPILVKHEERIVRQMRKSASIFNRDLDQGFVATVSSIVQRIVGRNAYMADDSRTTGLPDDFACCIGYPLQDGKSGRPCRGPLFPPRSSSQRDRIICYGHGLAFCGSTTDVTNLSHRACRDTWRPTDQAEEDHK
jgi:hypothetical protein